MSEPLLSSQISDGCIEVAAAGSWTVRNITALEPLIEAVVSQSGLVLSLAIDARGVRELDTFGAWLLEKIIRNAEARGKHARIVGLPEHYRGLIEKVQQTNRRTPAVRAKGGRLLTGLEKLGCRVIDLSTDLTALVAMLGALGSAVGKVFIQPRGFRLTSAVHQLDRVGWQAVPIVLLITFLIGCIIAQQGFFHFRKFGADDYVVDLVGILVLREIGVLILRACQHVISDSCRVPIDCLPKHA